jgi:hypothetical protein
MILREKILMEKLKLQIFSKLRRKQRKKIERQCFKENMLSCMEEESTTTCKPITCTRGGSKTTLLSKEDAFNQTVLILKATSKMTSKKPKGPYI